MELIKVKCRQLVDQKEVKSFLIAARLMPGFVFAYVDKYLRPCVFVMSDCSDEIAIRGQERVIGNVVCDSELFFEIENVEVTNEIVTS